MLGSVWSESLALIFGNSHGDITVHNQKDGWVTNCKSTVQLKFRSRRHGKEHHTKFSKSNCKVSSLGMMIWFYDIPEKQYVRQEKRLLYCIQMKNCAECGALYLRKSWLLPADHIFIYCFMPWTACLQVLERISSPLLHNLSWLFCFVPWKPGRLLGGLQEDLLSYSIGTEDVQILAPMFRKSVDPTRSQKHHSQADWQKITGFIWTDCSSLGIGLLVKLNLANTLRI